MGDSTQQFGLGFSPIDTVLGAGLERGAIHEILTSHPADVGAAAGFAIALALRAVEKAQPVVWVRQTSSGYATGNLYAPGLKALGLNPDQMILVELRDTLELLRAGLEAMKCTALGAVILEPWGKPQALDFTATRRMALAATQSGVPVFLLRPGIEPQHSAAQTRWQIGTAASRPGLANGPGLPVFNITLLRQRSGPAGQSWQLEWDHEHRIFRQPTVLTPLSGPLVSPPVRGPLPAPAASRTQHAPQRARAS
ncbi:hypothetical protein PSQ90_10735 [Devosia rhodophyticola]|uniref:Protein ImuA n=1 Tax=Devosia rhodophyticola TaxID=3026423 RepID=A0ABY7YTT0_9HYPH|nr:hypothetical protein [Devosia rhodophyticola]WDR04791.1 hypothetical protein PSQ90_10735 [Devosia rhodophyticola]